MSSANRMRQSLVREVTFATTPASPRMRTERITGESLRYTPKFTQSAELRSDRMNADPIKVNETTDGGINFELSFPEDGSALSERLVSMMWNDWVKTPTRDNDGTADSVITNIATSGTIATVVTGASFAVGHLVKFSGFAIAGNNGVFRVTTASATVPAFVGSGITDETVPPAAAKMKVVGARGVASDINATASGLSSTTLDFTTLGLAVGQWIKIGGTLTANKFVTAANNAWVRITAIAATALTCDNLPSGWATETGTGLLISFWFGDQIKNGTTRYSHSTERAFLDQTVPTYVIHRGHCVNTLALSIQAEKEITGSFGTMAMTSAEGTSAYGSTYDAATTNAVMAGSVNVGRISEGGSAVLGPNWVRSITVNLTNNDRMLGAVDNLGAVDLQPGDCDVSGQVETFFGSDLLYAKMIAGTVSSLSGRVTKNSQGIIIQLPRTTFTEGSANASGKNTDVVLPLSFMSSLDSATNAHIIIDRLPYFE
jgi:hypothetical protein